jgi:hypothetical protein
MRISVKLFGLARSLVKEPVIDLQIPDGGTYTDVVAALAEAHPELINLVIDPDGRTLLSANMFSLDGEQVIQPDQMEEHPAEGEQLLLMSIIVGG